MPRGLQVGLLDLDRRGGESRVHVAPLFGHHGLAAAISDQHRRLALAVDGGGGPARLRTPGVSRAQGRERPPGPASAASTESARTMSTGWPSYRIRSSENGITRTAD